MKVTLIKIKGHKLKSALKIQVTTHWTFLNYLLKLESIAKSRWQFLYTMCLINSITFSRSQKISFKSITHSQISLLRVKLHTCMNFKKIRSQPIVRLQMSVIWRWNEKFVCFQANQTNVSKALFIKLKTS